MAHMLVTGATGQLGSALLGPLHACGGVVSVALTSFRDGVRLVDLTNMAATRAMLDEIRPDTIVHLAAATNVDFCEKSAEQAYRLNVRATQTLVEWCLDRAPNAYFVYISTDQVYDGDGPSAEHQVRPKNVYALTKLWGEDHARRLARHCVLRVNFFTGGSGQEKGLVSWLLASARSENKVRLFTDVLFNPLHVDNLSGLIVEMMQRDAVGTFNLGASDEGLSKAAFLRAVARRLGLPDAKFEDCSVDDVALAAYRPRDMRMNVNRAEQVLGHKLPTVAAGIQLLAADVYRSQPE
jgi:dTDP-4-dehydrorhamnose reductase